ncbi:MAG TPA: SDR family oxidoreductase [Solirubrobacterales bacterium]|nr:SDR family oxidoreductase [Solirubrobacterales bacterium]
MTHTGPSPTDTDGAVLLTGATGFVGMELLSRYLERSERGVYALIRAPDGAAAEERLREVRTSLYSRPDAYADRVTAVAGDIESPGLGLDDADRALLGDRVTEIVHSAASVSFSLPLEAAREVNVEGTRRMLELAQDCALGRGGLKRFSYLSTAYVAGDHGGEFGEDQLDEGQRFRNSYERSKFEAERLVHAYADHLPVQVFRPSIVVGERTTGWTNSFNVLYPPLKAFARGAYPAIPGRRSTPVDVVPVDYVADAVFELSNRPLTGNETYHLVAGPQATSAGRIATMAARYFGRRPPWMLPPRIYRRLIHPLVVRRTQGRRRRALEQSEALFPYFSMRVRFDDTRARSRLVPAGVRVSPLEQYFERLLDFAVRARWGRSAPGRAEARGAPAAVAA